MVKSNDDRIHRSLENHPLETQHFNAESRFERMSTQLSVMEPRLPQASSSSRFNARRWLQIGGIVVFYYLVARAPLPFVTMWWGAGAPNWSSALNERQRMADWMLLTHSLEELTRAAVVARLGEPEPAEYNASGEDLVYILGSARGILSFDALEALVLRLDANGKVAGAKIHRD